MKASEGDLGTSFLLFICMSLQFWSEVIARLTPQIALTLEVSTFYLCEMCFYSNKDRLWNFLAKNHLNKKNVCVCMRERERERERGRGVGESRWMDGNML